MSSQWQEHFRKLTELYNQPVPPDDPGPNTRINRLWHYLEHDLKMSKFDALDVIWDWERQT